MIRILYIEDDEDHAYMLCRRLGRRGYETSRAADGAQGLALAAELRPDLIILDLKLPDMDGWAVLEALRQDSATRPIPVIVVSAHVLRGEGEQAVTAGAAAFVRKPIELPALLEKIESLTGDTDTVERRSRHDRD